MKKLKSLDFKQPRYVYPLLALPFILIILWQFKDFYKEDEVAAQPVQEISTNFGETNQIIKDKQSAYQDFYNMRSGDGRTLVGGLDDETDSLQSFEDMMTAQDKRYIDSLNLVKNKEKQRLEQLSNNAKRQSYYTANQSVQSQSDKDKEYERSMKIIEMLNGSNQNNSSNVNNVNEQKKQEDPTAMMRKQMLFLDSLEKANDPDYQAQVQAEETLKRNAEKMDAFLNSTLSVSKAGKNENFNSIYKQRETSFIKAIIDENTKGYLGSRIQIRLLENIYVESMKLPAGTIMYAQISGFTLQRVNLNIVSVMVQNEILPVNLSIYDVDGMKGLYVPASVFREMTRTMGENSVQGMNMNMSNSDFYTNMLTSLFQSTSKTISDLIRKNKVKVKYNSFIYLIDEQELQKRQNEYKK